MRKITEVTRNESYLKLDAETVSNNIINILRDKKVGLTAREVSEIMYKNHQIPYPVRQAVAPRLTELEKEDKVKVVGKAYDEETKRSVAVYKIVD